MYLKFRLYVISRFVKLRIYCNQHFLTTLGHKKDEEEIRSLKRGDYFGEQALLKKEFRTANVIAESEIVECFVFDRESFFGLVGDISELRDKNYNDEARQKTKIKSIEDKKVSKEYQDLR